MSRSPCIAILARSTNQRVGVVHASDAFGRGFFRPSLCSTVAVVASPEGSSVGERVESRIADYVRHFENPERRRFDVFYAQDGVSGNALAEFAYGTPVATSKIPPFAEHFGDDVLWCDPLDVATITCAIKAIRPEIRVRLPRCAGDLLATSSWDRSAAAHLPVHQRLWEIQHA